MDYLLGIDLGTTGCKAAVCALDGVVAGQSYHEYPLQYPAPGLVEQDAAAWWAHASRASREAVAAAGVPAGQIRAVAISSQGLTFVPVDDAGQPLRPAIVWLDRRATAEARLIEARWTQAEIYELTGKRIDGAYVLPKLLWLRRHEPALFGHTNRFLLAHDYLLYHLCGAAMCDFSLAGGTLLLDLSRLRWSNALLEAFELDPVTLPQLAWAGTAAGTIRHEAASALGLEQRTLAVVGGQDQKCAAFGAGLRPGAATISLGTAAAISCLTDRPILEPQATVPLFPFVRPGQWVLEGVVGPAGVALRWLRDVLLPGLTYGQMDALAADVPAGARGVLFFPHLAGPSSPDWYPAASGCFWGLTLAANRADLIRSVLEGVAFLIHRNVARLRSLATIDELILFGGGARSALWADILCQVTGLPVSVLAMADVSLWGACALAGIGAGLIDRHEPPAAVARIMPRPAAAERYAELYRRYCTIEAQYLAPGWASPEPQPTEAGGEA